MRGIKNTIEDVWLQVEKTENCWLWTGNLDKDGYGVWWLDGKNVRAHRLISKIYGKEIKPPFVSRHLCHVRKCVNPDHIVQGTQRENVQDQLRLGTHSKLQYPDELIETIKTEYANTKTTTRRLAAKYGVSKTQVGYIVQGKTRQIKKEN